MDEYVVERSGRRRRATRVQCDYCGEYFLKANTMIKRMIKRDTHKHYCNRSCVSNSSKIRMKVECVQCGKEFEVRPNRIKTSKSGLLFCSVECKNMGQRLEHCHPDMRPKHFNNGVTTYRVSALRSQTHICACGDCGFDIKEVLEVHHIDCDRTNNTLDNLIILCPTHHKMAHHGFASIDENVYVSLA